MYGLPELKGRCLRNDDQQFDLNNPNITVDLDADMSASGAARTNDGRGETAQSGVQNGSSAQNGGTRPGLQHNGVTEPRPINDGSGADSKGQILAKFNHILRVEEEMEEREGTPGELTSILISIMTLDETSAEMRWFRDNLQKKDKTGKI